AARRSGIPRRLLQAAVGQTHGPLRGLREGPAFVVRSRPLRTVLVAWTIAMVAIAAINTTEVLLAKDSFNAGDFGYGLLFGSIGLGLAIGSLGAGALVERRPVALVYGGAIGLNALGFSFAAVGAHLASAAVDCCLAWC